MFAIPILLCVVLLQTPVAESQVKEVRKFLFQPFCKCFVFYGGGSKGYRPKILAELDAVYTYFKEDFSLFPDDSTSKDEDLDFLRKKRCVDRSSVDYPECFFLLAWEIMNDNPDWNQIQLDEIPQLNLLKIYVGVWNLHPGMKCLNFFKSITDPLVGLVKGMADQADTYAKILTKTELQTTKLRQGIEKICKTDADNNICPDVLDIARLVDAYNAVKDEAKDGAKWNAYQLHFIYLKHNFQERFKDVYPSDQVTNDLIVKNLEQVFAYLNTAQYTKLKDMMTLVPGKFSSSDCEKFASLPKTAENVCMLGIAMTSLQAYLKSQVPQVNKQVKKILITNIDYKTFLGLTEMDRILEIVQNQEGESTDLAQWVETEVKKTVSNRFLGLQQYFQNVESFNRDKAKADVDFIYGRLDFYKKDVASLTSDLTYRLGDLINYACTSVAAEIAENTIQLGLAVMENINPLAKIFGGSSFGDILDRTATLANSLTDIALMEKVAESFQEVRRKVNKISSRFGKNADFLENLNTLIQSIAKDKLSQSFDTQRQQFLDGYTAYDPQVTRPELTAMSTTYVNLIEACCDVILNTETSAAAVPKGVVQRRGLCPKAKEVAEEMIETFAEIYDFQFDLVESMASYMRATTSQYSAKDINAYYKELSRPESPSDEVVSQLRILTSVAYIAYKIDVLQVSEVYCDILAYKEGGNQPSVCQGIETNIPNLVSYKSPTCRNIETYADVPTSSTSDQGFMSISDLYAGKPVTFKIPNSQWLVTNKWVTAEEDKDLTIVVKKFEVFLPAESEIYRSIRVNAKVTADNKISTSSDTSYVIVPSKELIFDYLEGTGSEQSCREASQLLTSPYGGTLPKLCRLNVDEINCKEKTDLFHSVYARWKITLSGYESAPPPKPVNDDFKLRVGVRLCILDVKSTDQVIKAKKRGYKFKNGWKKEAKLKDQERQSCPKGSYWSRKSTGCAPCPKGSRSALDGYFCEKIPEKMP